MPIHDDDKRMRARDSELAEDCATINKQWDRELKAELGVAEWEQLMIAVYLPLEFRDIDDNATPEEEAAAIAARLRRPVAVVDDEHDQLLAFARPKRND
jgi:hypothetical protein